VPVELHFAHVRVLEQERGGVLGRAGAEALAEQGAAAASLRAWMSKRKSTTYAGISGMPCNR